MTPEEYLEAADRDVYSLVDERRAELFGSDGGFNIEFAGESLRQHVLSDKWSSEQPLTLTDCLRIAAESSRSVQDQKEALYLAALDLTLERWQFGNRPFASLDGVAGGTGTESADATVDGSAGFTRLLGSGASIVTSIGSNLFRVLSSDDGWDLVTDLSLAITQPLMRGAGRAIAMEPLTQAERNLVYQVRSYERFRRLYAVDVAARVYDLLQAIDELKNEERNYDALVKLTERNEALAEAGRLSDIQADQARQDELRSETRLISLRAGLERQRDQFNLFLGLPIDVALELDQGEFDRLTGEDPWIEALNAARASTFALEHRLDHMTVVDAVADRARNVEIAEDALRAGLTLATSAGTGDAGGSPLSDISFQDTEWQASLSLDLPVDRKSERNSYRRSLINLAAARRSLAEDEDRIQADVREALRAVENGRQSYRIQEGAVVLALRRVESASLNLDAGRAETRDLLDAQSDLVTAENAATSSLITFTLARLDLALQLEVLEVDATGIRVMEETLAQFVEEKP